MRIAYPFKLSASVQQAALGVQIEAMHASDKKVARRLHLSLLNLVKIKQLGNQPAARALYQW